MRDFSEEDIQRAADEVKKGDFWDFMFRDPGQNRGTTRRRTSRHRTSGRMTSRRNTSRRNTSRNRNTSRQNTSRRNTSRRKTTRCCCHTKWRNSSRGNYQMKCCWKDGNMWSLRIRKRRK